MGGGIPQRALAGPALAGPAAVAVAVAVAKLSLRAPRKDF
jgi:hypothetical protein